MKLKHFKCSSMFGYFLQSVHQRFSKCQKDLNSVLNHWRTLPRLLCKIILLVIIYKGSFPARYYVHNMPHECSCLDNNHQAFLLIDDGSVGHRGTETMFRANLEDFISHQRTGIWGERKKTVQLKNKTFLKSS